MEIKNVGEATSLVHMNLKWDLLNRLESFQIKNKYRNRSETVHLLLDFSLKIMEMIESTPPHRWQKEIEELKAQRKEGDIMAYAESLPASELKLLYEIFLEERKRREYRAGLKK